MSTVTSSAVPFDNSRWQVFVVDHTQKDWGDLQPYLQVGKLNGAIIIGVDDKAWHQRDLAHKLIPLMQSLNGWLEVSDFKEGDVIDDLRFAQHAAVINGPLRLTKDQRKLLEETIEGKEFQVKVLKELLNKNPQSKEINKNLSELEREIRTRKNYLYLDNKAEKKGKVKKIIVSDSGAPGIETGRFELGKANIDEYTKLVVIVPPENIARRVNDLSQISAMHEIEELARFKKERIPFHYKQGAITPFIGSTAPPASARRIKDSTARAVVDLIHERPMRKRTGEAKQMICSEFVTRILQAAVVCEELGDENMEHLRHVNDKKAVEIVKKWIPDHPLLKMRPAGTMPCHLVALSGQVSAVVYDTTTKQRKVASAVVSNTADKQRQVK
jgi:hypothetical protein